MLAGAHAKILTPDCVFDKESQSNQKTFYSYFCVLHFPLMNIILAAV